MFAHLSAFGVKRTFGGSGGRIDESQMTHSVIGGQILL
jgi:hypothetical protein